MNCVAVKQEKNKRKVKVIYQQKYGDKAIRAKRRLHRQWINNLKNKNAKKTPKNISRNQVKSQMRQAKRTFEHDIANKAPKKFWSFVRCKLKTRSRCFAAQKNQWSQDSLFFDDKIKQIFSASVFTKKPNDNSPKFNLRTNSILENILITRQMVRKKLQQWTSVSPWVQMKYHYIY